MKKLILLGIFISCGLLQASDDDKSEKFLLELPINNQRMVLKVNLNQQDPITQQTFAELMEESYKNNKSYGMTIYKCFGNGTQLAYQAADSESFLPWARTNLTDPITRKAIIRSSIQCFAINQNGPDGNFEVFRAPTPKANFFEASAFLLTIKSLTDLKRKRDDTQENPLAQAMKSMKTTTPRTALLENAQALKK